MNLNDLTKAQKLSQFGIILLVLLYIILASAATGDIVYYGALTAIGTIFVAAFYTAHKKKYLLTVLDLVIALGVYLHFSLMV